MPKPFRVILLALLLLALPLAATAQSTIQAVLSAPETDSYPQISSTLTVRDDEGRFVSGLAARDIVMVENGVEIPVQTLDEQTPGARIVIAIDPSPAFSVRDTTGATRYDYIVAALNAWADSKGTTVQDELALTITNGPTAPKIDDYDDLVAELAAAPSDHRNSATNISTLTTAIEIASAPASLPGMGRAILWITPHAEIDAIQALETLAGRAIDADIRIFIWMVTSEAFFVTNGAFELEAIAEATGGSLFAFSGTESLPDPETYFDSLRRIYSLTYLSETISSGDFELSASVVKPGFETVSAPTTLSLNVLPPNPIFVSPPNDIYRSLVPDSEGNLSAERRSPNSQEMEILIEFPDGYLRELVRTTLYVNGQIAAENTAAPFDRFVWDLTPIAESGRFTLQVEAVDEYGLSSISLETPVNITVQFLPEGFAPAFTRNSPLVVTVVVVLVGAVLIGVLLRVRHLRPNPRSRNGIDRKKKRRTLDPVYQPVAEETRPASTARLSRWATRLHWPQRSTPRDEPIAYLDRIYDNQAARGMTPRPPLAIHSIEVTLGQDPSQASFILDEPSVAGLHARIHRNLESEFFISDYGSIAGTYINYLPINGGQARIDHGDIVHFGTAGFRFRLNPSPQTPLPSIEPEESP